MVRREGLLVRGHSQPNISHVGCVLRRAPLLTYTYTLDTAVRPALVGGCENAMDSFFGRGQSGSSQASAFGGVGAAYEWLSSAVEQARCSLGPS